MQDSNPNRKKLAFNNELMSKSNFFKDKNAIFKFTPYSINALKIIINSELWFGEPQTQNDPYEGEFIFKKSSKSLSEDLKKRILNRVDPELKKFSIENFNNPTLEYYIVRLYQESLKNTIKKMNGICSFSKKYKEKLLWTHYADAYKGLCFVFDRMLLTEYLEANVSTKCFKPTYEHEIPKIDINSSESDFKMEGSNILKFKFRNFKYEDEVRYIRLFQDEDHRGIKYPYFALKSIILSENMKISDMKTVINLLKSNSKYNHVRVLIACKNIYSKDIEIQFPEKKDSPWHYKLYKEYGASPRLPVFPEMEDDVSSD